MARLRVREVRHSRLPPLRRRADVALLRRQIIEEFIRDRISDPFSMR